MPFSISLTVNLIFLLQYWLPETSDFPDSEWWMTQLAPLASPWLTSRGQPQVTAQYDSGLAPAVMLVAGFFLVCLSRSRRWWGRIGILVPAAVGGLAGLGILVRLLATGGNRTSTLSVMLLLLWMIAAGYVAAQGFQDRLGTPPPKSWRSGLPALVGLRPDRRRCPPRSAARCSAPSCGTWRCRCEGNTVALRLSALWTASTAWLYLSGLMVGVSLWVLYRWWPLRRGTAGHRSADRHGGDADHHQRLRLDGGQPGRRPDDPARPGQPGGRGRVLVRRLGSTPEQPHASRCSPSG